jgi:glutathione S-transferase
MIDLYYWPTPNGHKITMFLEEAGLEYQIVPVDIARGEQFKPDFLAISPNNRMPAIVDQAPLDGGEPVSVFESGAILLYLAEKTGRLLPKDVRGRTAALEWLFWQVGGLRSDGGSESSFQPLRCRENHLRDRALRQGNQPSVWRTRSTSRRSALSGGPRVLDCRCGGLSMDRTLAAAVPRSLTVSRAIPVVRGNRCSPWHCARLRPR